MKYFLTAIALTLALTANAHAGGRYHSGSCGAEFSITGSQGSNNGLNGYTDGPMFGSDRFDRSRSNSIGFTLSFPLGGQDCDFVEAQASAQRAEADRLKQIARKQKLENLQILVMTCRTEPHLSVCSKIDEMSRDIF